MSTAALQRTLVFLYLGIDMVCFAICIVLVARLNVEKYLDADHDAILAHQKAQVRAEGGTWVDPAERARLEQEEADKEAEEARVQELEETCRVSTLQRRTRSTLQGGRSRRTLLSESSWGSEKAAGRTEKKKSRESLRTEQKGSCPSGTTKDPGRAAISCEGAVFLLFSW